MAGTEESQEAARHKAALERERARKREAREKWELEDGSGSVGVAVDDFQRRYGADEEK
ncbi:hypothetical protein [Streptomyces sp. NPDC089799]|uniref:hypothetical protein n=1 Tax=Streptomyces sp. NPDC089799 TaxID=3155066 RepID=UPI00342B9E03